MEHLPRELRLFIFAHISRNHLAPLLWVSREWREDAQTHMDRSLWPRLVAQFHSSFLTVQTDYARRHVLTRYVCYLYKAANIPSSDPRYLCARCHRSCTQLGQCQVCLTPRLSHPLRRILLGPSLLAIFLCGLAWLSHRRGISHFSVRHRAFHVHRCLFRH